MNEIGKRVRTPQIGEPAPSASKPGGGVHLHANPPFLSLLGRQAKAELNVALPRRLQDSEFYLVADIYRQDMPVHPLGHVGWWSFALGHTGAIALEVSADDGRIAVTAGNVEGLGRWVNEALDLPRLATLLLHVVLRHRPNDEIAHIQSLALY